jgi:hypothetical protein
MPSLSTLIPDLRTSLEEQFFCISKFANKETAEELAKLVIEAKLYSSISLLEDLLKDIKSGESFKR